MSIALTSPIQWPAEALWEALAPALPGFTVEVLPEIDSSNSELMRRFRGSPGGFAGDGGSNAKAVVEPRPEPLLLIAEHQTAGRGRLGRSWQSRRGDSLTFSLGLPLHPADWSGLSLVVGISVAESLDPQLHGNTTLPRIGLKWPNDLWMRTPQGERKLGGILVETAVLDGLRYVVVGIGLNIRPCQLPDLSATLPVAGNDGNQGSTPFASIPAGCLQELFPDLDAPAALLRLAPALVQNIRAFEEFGFSPFQARFAARDVLSGRAVRLSDGVAGSAHGVGENGALLVHTAAGMKQITSSEVSVRPVAEDGENPSSPAKAGPC